MAHWIVFICKVLCSRFLVFIVSCWDEIDPIRLLRKEARKFVKVVVDVSKMHFVLNFEQFKYFRT